MLDQNTRAWVDHSVFTLEVCAEGLANLNKTDPFFTNITAYITCATPDTIWL